MSGNLRHNRPHETPGFGVHARRRLVKENDRRVSDDGDGNRQLAFVSTRKVACCLFAMQGKVQSLDCVFDNLLHVLNTLQSPEVPEVLLYSQVVKQGVELRTVS